MLCKSTRPLFKKLLARQFASNTVTEGMHDVPDGVKQETSTGPHARKPLIIVGPLGVGKVSNFTSITFNRAPSSTTYDITTLSLNS